MKNIWNVLSAVAGLLAVGVTVFVFYQDRAAQRKALEVQLVARSRLVNEAMTLPQRRIELLYNGQRIPNYEIHQLRTANTGRQPIRSEDYEAPIKLTFSNIQRILSVDQTGADPTGLAARASFTDSTVTLGPILLNPTDWFTIEVGVVPAARDSSRVTLGGRIAGIKQIEFKESAPPPRPGGLSTPLRILTLLQGVLVAAMLVLQWSRFFGRRRAHID